MNDLTIAKKQAPYVDNRIGNGYYASSAGAE